MPKVIVLVWLLLFCVVAALSLWPGGVVTDQYNIDKLGHFSAYTALALFPALSIRSMKWVVGIAVFLVVAGICFEAGQLLVPGRVASFLDGLANITGVFAGTIIGVVIAKKRLLSNTETSHIMDV